MNRLETTDNEEKVAMLLSSEDTTNQQASEPLVKVDWRKRPYAMTIAGSIVVAGTAATIAWIVLLTWLITGVF